MSTVTCIRILHILLLLLLLSISYGCDESCDECLTSLDFSSGTYRIIESGKYCLSENIEFNPLSGNIFLSPNIEDSKLNWFPNDESLYLGCDQLKNGPFALGYFAAITIETNDVEIDLYGFQISQHLYFYIQQRFFSIIEIGKSPFLEGFGPTDFGPFTRLESVDNIYIHNGKLGLSSHHGIHSNEGNNVRIEDMIIDNFEVAGIQFNGFSGVQIRNVQIGPSATNVQPSGYYSNAKFLSFAFNKLLSAIIDNGENPNDKTVIFSGNRQLTIQQIYDNLLTSIDIAFRYFVDASTDHDIEHELYSKSIALYENVSKFPDGSTLYGIVMHSRAVAVFGFGNFENEPGDGENVLLENVKIHDLINCVNEIPATYFDECDNSETKNPIKGPFADVMDLRLMVGDSDKDIIDEGMDYTILEYKGNPLSDAQIALGLYGPKYNDLDYGSVGMDQHSHFLQWALNEYEGKHYETLPECIDFMCNGDVMQHTNKGVIGVRFDLIEDIQINKLEISNLLNKSPLGSYACKNYTGQYDGGSQGQLDLKGSMGSDVTGMTLYGGDVIFNGDNKLDGILSECGSAMGMHLMHNAYVYIDDTATIDISSNIISGLMIDESMLKTLINDNKYPYPNNFYQCNILLDKNDQNNAELFPNPPNGINYLFCEQNLTSQTVVGSDISLESDKFNDGESESDEEESTLFDFNDDHAVDSPSNTNDNIFYNWIHNLGDTTLYGLCVPLILFLLIMSILCWCCHCKHVMQKKCRTPEINRIDALP